MRQELRGVGERAARGRLGAAIGFVVLVLLVGAGGAPAASRSPDELEVGGRQNPLGIDSLPRFSWDSNTSEQVAYRVRVWEDRIGGRDRPVWDSGKRAGSQDVNVRYAGRSLKSATRYEWRVRVWDVSGRGSRWSHPATFETGLLEASDWGSARYIGGRVPQDNDWTDMTASVDFRATRAAEGITFFFHAQPVGKTWGEAYVWQLRASAVNTTLTIPGSAGDTRIRVASVADFAVGDVVTVGAGQSEESRTITGVGSGPDTATLAAAAEAGATTITVNTRDCVIFGGGEFCLGPAATFAPGDLITIGDEQATVQAVGDPSSDGSTRPLTLESPLAAGAASGATVTNLGTGVTVSAGFSAAHAAGERVTTPTKLQLGMQTRHYAGNTGVPGGTPEVDWGVNFYDPQSEKNPTAAGTRTVPIGAVRGDELAGINPDNLTTRDHRLRVRVDGNTITTWLNDVQVDSRTVSGDQVRRSGTIGVGSVGSPIVREIAVAPESAPSGGGATNGFRTRFEGLVNPLEAGIPTEAGLMASNKDAFLPIANPAPLLRKTFRGSAARVRRARLYVTAGGWPVVTVNGRPLTVAARKADNVARLVPDHTNHEITNLYNTFDVTRLIRSSSNVLAAELGRGWYGVTVPGEWYWNMAPFHGSPRLMARLVVDYANGRRQVVTTDDSWRTTDGPTTFDSVYTGEDHDARIAERLGAWRTASYDAGGWRPATEMNPPGSCQSPRPAPCHGFIPDTPPAPSGFKPARLRAQENEPVLVKERLRAKAIYETYPGSRVYIFDFGQIHSGWARVDLTGVAPSQAGRTLRIRADEVQSGDGTEASPYAISENNGFIDGHFQVDSYTLSQRASQTWETQFRYGGQRFFEVRGLYEILGREPNLSTDADLITAVVARSGFETIGAWQSSNALLNRIYSNATWAQRNNLVHKSTDTPTREKNGWTGDAWADDEAAIQAYDLNRFFTKWLRDYPDSQISTGELSEIVPAVKGGYGYQDTPGWDLTFGPTPAWDHAFFEIPWDLYAYYENTDLLAELYPAQKRLLAYYANYFTAANNYTFAKPLLGEYAAAGGTGDTSVINHQLYYRMLDHMATTGRLLGRDADAAAYRALADDVLRTFIAKHWDEETHSFQKPPLGNLETTNTLAVAFDMVPGSDLSPSNPRYLSGTQTQTENERSTAAVVAEDIRARDNHLGIGIYGSHFMFDVLSDHGYTDLLYSVATQTTAPSWGHQIGLGATSLWENWTSGSQNHHYWSTINTWFYQHLAGIKPAAPAYRQVVIKPHVPTNSGTSSVPPDTSQQATLDHVEASQRTIRGRITSAWRRVGENGLRLDVRIPSNTPAEIWVPRAADQQVTAPRSARFLRNDNGYAVYRVGAGRYRFDTR